MAANKTLERGTPLMLAVPAAASVKSGDPLVFGTLPCVANEADGDATRPSTGRISVDNEGCFSFSVTAKSSLSPSTGSAVNVGDKIYLDGGTTDATTAITYGGTLDKNTGGKLFGTAVSIAGASGQLIASSGTGTISIRLLGAPA